MEARSKSVSLDVNGRQMRREKWTDGALNAIRLLFSGSDCVEHWENNW